VAFSGSFYGGGFYGGGPFGGIPPAIPTIIEVYDTLGNYKWVYQSGVGNFLGCQFTIDESGCRDFTLFFAGKAEIIKSDIIKISLYNSSEYFFTGVVRRIPIDGSTEESFNYEGFGFNDYLLRISAESESYNVQTLSQIVNDLVDTYIVPKTPITKNAAKIDLPAITIDLDINYTQMPDVLSSLQKIANSDGVEYVVGVDTEGDFFFKPKSTEVQTTLVVGKNEPYGIEQYEPEDEYEAKTKYFLLDKDGLYITEINATTPDDIFEEKLTAPDMDDTSAEKWAEGILLENETPTRRATIQWKIENYSPLLLIADGTIRIISNIFPTDPTAPEANPYGSGTYSSGLYGGGQYQGKDLDDTLKIKEVTYIMAGTQSVRQIQLGALPIRLDDDINKVRKDLVDLRVSLGR